MTDLLRDPAWRPEQLGTPLPDCGHAVSVAMPLWEHVVGYEMREPRIVDALRSGYPRFVYHPEVVALVQECESRFAHDGECTMAFPTEGAARRCERAVHRQTGMRGRIDTIGATGAAALTLPTEAAELVKGHLQCGGEIVSSRLARATAGNSDYHKIPNTVHDTLRSRIASWVDEVPSNVSLYSTGMAAVYSCIRLLKRRTPDAASIQIGLPYSDVLRIQKQICPTSHFLPDLEPERFRAYSGLIESGGVGGVFTEVPSNPLLCTVDLPSLSADLRRRGIPLIIDETIGTYHNVDLRPYADIIVTSLTKYFSGVGNVMGGAAVFNSQSPLYPELMEAAQSEPDEFLWIEDAEVLEQNSRDITARMSTVNRTAELLFEMLRSHPKIDKVYYPKHEPSSNYSCLMRPVGGYGGIMSLLPKNPMSSMRLYDFLRICKGPSMGTNFTLACPYTILAHFQELDWAESVGASRHLIRVSVGLEDPSDLLGRFTETLDRI